MKVTVVGASGRTGRLVLQAAHDRGHEVTAYVRDPDRIPVDVRPLVSIVVGDLDNPRDTGRDGNPDHVLDGGRLRDAVRKADAVVVTLGLHSRSANPWSRLVGPDDVARRGAEALMTALGDRPARIVLMSAAGVGTSRRELPWVARAVIATGRIRHSYADLHAAEQLLQASPHDVVVVRAVTLTDDEPGKPPPGVLDAGRNGSGSGPGYRTLTGRLPLSARLSRTAVAAALLDACESAESSRTITIGPDAPTR